MSVGGSNVLVCYTFAGDSNLDGNVNTGDFNVLAQNFNATGKTWTDGDANYDGVINALDFNAVATNFGQSLPSAPVLGTLVPEPTSIGLLGLSGIGLARRRRKSG